MLTRAPAFTRLFHQFLRRAALPVCVIAAAVSILPLRADAASMPQRDGGPESKLYVARDTSGAGATFRGGQMVIDKTNPFFHSLGTNGRACYSCHRPGVGWSMSPQRAQEIFDASNGAAPLFAPIDAATCPTADLSSRSAMLQAFSLLLNKGLIRIALPIPQHAQFSVVAVDDPYGCTTLQSPTSGTISMYRRPLPATNLRFANTIMWDGREPTLKSQAKDATIVHEQPINPPTDMQLSQIVAYDTSTFAAQLADNSAGPLSERGANGGPIALSQVQASFGGMSFGMGTGQPAFNLFSAWQNLFPNGPLNMQRRSIAHGQQIFNTKQITLTGVAGLNDGTGKKTIQGTCGTCHNRTNVGNDSAGRFMNIGVADGSRRTPDLPLFTLKCNSGPLAGKTFQVTDPGRALITGQCADIGKFKTPGLRGLAARPPYFHNGSTATLTDNVEFYDDRFGVGFTDQEKADLVNFLSAL